MKELGEKTGRGQQPPPDTNGSFERKQKRKLLCVTIRAAINTVGDNSVI